MINLRLVLDNYKTPILTILYFFWRDLINKIVCKESRMRRQSQLSLCQIITPCISLLILLPKFGTASEFVLNWIHHSKWVRRVQLTGIFLIIFAKKEVAIAACWQAQQNANTVGRWHFSRNEPSSISRRALSNVQNNSLKAWAKLNSVILEDTKSPYRVRLGRYFVFSFFSLQSYFKKEGAWSNMADSIDVLPN
jgi:hypothetical protein